MAIQHFWTAASTIAFPQGIRPVNILVSLIQLYKLFFHSPTKRLVGVWTQTATEDSLSDHFGKLWRLGYIWRDGTPMDLFSVPANLLQHTLTACATTDGRVLRGPEGSINRANVEMSAAVTDALYPISTRWAGDILTNTRVASAAAASSSPMAAIVFEGGNAWTIEQATTGTTTFKVVQRPVSTVLFTSTGATWRHARDLMYIDSKTVAATFMQHSSIGADGDAAARIRVFDTTTTPWTLKWEDMLPGTDNRACFDQVEKVLYSCNRNPGAIMHASRLRQMPTSISPITLVTGSTLVARTATVLSTLVTNELNCGISGATVRWTLTSKVSGGSITSAYSKTNDSGVAQITYVGPHMSVTTTTETVSAEVAEIWPKGQI